MNKYILFLILIAGCRGKKETTTILFFKNDSQQGWVSLIPGSFIFAGKDSFRIGEMTQDAIPEGFPRPINNFVIPIHPDTVYIHDTIYLRAKSTNINHINQLNQY